MPSPNPFSLADIEERIRDPRGKRLFAFLRPSLEHVLGIRGLSRLYAPFGEQDCDTNFSQRALNVLNISYEICGEHAKRFPTEGPVVVVANHPFGGVEGLVLANVLKSFRADAKVMANYMLARLPGMRQYCIFVDPFGTESSSKKNLAPMRDSIAWLKQGGVLGIFPSGTVSHFHWKSREVRDPEWSESVVKLIKRSHASVVPVFFEGANGFLFQLLGVFHPKLRTLMLPRELYNKTGSHLKLRIGSPITYDRLRRFDTDAEMMEFLRLRTYLLGGRPPQSGRRAFFTRIFRQQPQAPLAVAQDQKVLTVEVHSLPEHQRLLANGSFEVYYARAGQIPHVLLEIGRLRELTFRLVKEGTGRARDVDRYDNFYTHLFLWNKEKRSIVGAYRLVKSDYVLRNFGKRGFYTHTLFSYRTALLRQMGPSIELGRSFVRPEYQKNYATLLMLWRGIATYVARNPRYRILFGPVSINHEYDTLSRQLIVTFLKENRSLPEIAKLVKPRNPLRAAPVRGVHAADTSRIVGKLEDVTEILEELESKHKALPVLLRQYLKLGGKLLGFNVDPNFGDVLDGLIYVDLTETDRRSLDRYMGKEEAQRFLAYHGKRETEEKTPELADTTQSD